MVFVDLYAGGGGSTTAAVTLHTVDDESRKMEDGVARSPSRLCSKDGKIGFYGDALSTNFLFALAPCFLFFFFIFLFFSYVFLASRYVYLLRVPSSVQQPSATLSKYVFHSTCSFCLCHLYPYPSRNSFVLYSFNIFFHSFYFSGGVCFRFALVPGTLALDLPTLVL